MNPSEYWKRYELFNRSFKESNRPTISDSLEDARCYVNGMTDGWFEFLEKLILIRKQYSDLFVESEKIKISDLISELEEHLKQ